MSHSRVVNSLPSLLLNTSRTCKEFVAESSLHRSLKSRVTEELVHDGYNVFREPLFPPTSLMAWSRYRPDLLAVRAREGREDFVMVECETRPSTRRMNSKNFRSVQLQSKIHLKSNLKRILVVPRGKLNALDSKLRLLWEIWLASDTGFQKFPLASCPTAD